MTFVEWIGQFPKVAAPKLAKRAIREVPELIAAYLADRIEHARRADLRVQESLHVDAFLRAMGGRSSVQSTIALGGELRHLVLPTEPFALGNGRKVTWADATVAEHEQRAAMLRAQIAGIGETIRRHEDAIRVLNESGASCLKELMSRTSAA